MLERLKAVFKPAAKEPTPAEKETAWSFETRPRCRHCGSDDTKAYATRGGVQYRKCRAPICRRSFSVQGRKS